MGLGLGALTCEMIQPTKAAIETRPCLISAWRYHRSLCSD